MNPLFIINKWTKKHTQGRSQQITRRDYKKKSFYRSIQFKISRSRNKTVNLAI